MTGRVLRSQKRAIAELVTAEPTLGKKRKSLKAEAAPRPTSKRKAPAKTAKHEEAAPTEDPTTSSSPSSTAKSASSLAHATEGKNYWLFKSEPESRIVNGHDAKFSFDDLKAMPNSTSPWDGVRNHEAKNNMVKMKIGDLAFFYHSNCKEPGIVGVVEVAKDAYDDCKLTKTKRQYTVCC